MKTIEISNITEIDVKKKTIRITKEKKFIFPIEIIGYPKTYNLTFHLGNKSFISTYTIGSKDGKSRSGLLRLGSDNFENILKINIETSLKITKLSENNYQIEKLGV